MATRQYIGARYVPKFMGEYDATQIYEALCVVDNGSGTSYISKVPTPAGTPLTNRDYWAIYGSASGAVIDLQNQIDTINNVTIPALEDEIEDVTKVPTDAKYIVIGDSFGYGVIDSSTYTDGWIDYLNDILPNNIFSWERSDQPVEGLPAFLGTLPFLTMFNWVIANKLGDVDPKEITNVVVLGGNNEPVDSTDAIKSHIVNNFIPAVKTACPNAQISIGCLGLSGKLLVDKAYTAYRDACLETGCTFISDTLNLGTLTQYGNTSGHWSEAGYAFYNPYIAQAVLHNRVDFRFTETHTLTLNPNVTIDGTVLFRLGKQISNHGVKLRLYTTTGYAGWRINNTGAIVGGIATLHALDVDGAIYTYFPHGASFTNCYLIDKVTGGIIGCGNAQMLLDGNNWYIQFSGFVQGSYTNNDPTNISAVFDGSRPQFIDLGI